MEKMEKTKETLNLTKETLFLTEESVKKTKETCRSCKNRISWEVGIRRIQYCEVRKSKRTFNKLQKINCKMPACNLYIKDLKNEY